MEGEERRGCQILDGGRILIGRMRRIKRKFWKEVRRVRKGGSRTEETMKDVNGWLLKGNEVKKRWAEYFEELLNVQEDRVADIVTMGEGGSGASNGRRKWERDYKRGGEEGIE